MCSSGAGHQSVAPWPFAALGRIAFNVVIGVCGANLNGQSGKQLN